MCRLVILVLAFSVSLADARSPVPPACASTSCPVGSTCVESHGRASCISPQSSNCSIPNEEWRSCASCEPTCYNKSPICNRMCQLARCQCRQGFFRNVDGSCHTEIDCDQSAGRRRRETPKNACANIKCAGGCKDTPTGPVCNGPRPLILPIWAGPSSTEAPRPEVLPIWAGPSSTPVTLNACAVTLCASGRVCVEEAGVAKCVDRRTRRGAPVTCAVVRCSPCTDTPRGPECGARPQILHISAGPASTTSNCSIPNEEWRSCASCEPTCDNKQPMCVMMCQPARCQCRQGFFRNIVGRCVTENECDAGRVRREAVRTPVDLNACAVTECVTGLVCVEKAGVAKCVERRTRRDITCANVRCAGPCTNTPTGPECGPRPQILPISEGPSGN